MAQLRASDVGRGTGRGHGRGRGRSTGPPRSRATLNPIEDIESYVNHGWWVTARRDTDATPFYGILHILVDPIRGETIYSGLGDEYGKIIHIARHVMMAMGVFISGQRLAPPIERIGTDYTEII